MTIFLWHLGSRLKKVPMYISHSHILSPSCSPRLLPQTYTCKHMCNIHNTHASARVRTHMHTNTHTHKCGDHLPTIILWRSFTNNNIVEIIYQQWYCRDHLPTMILQKSFTNNDIVKIIYQQWYCGNNLPTMILWK